MSSSDFGEVMHALMHAYRDSMRSSLEAAGIALAVPQIRLLKGIASAPGASASRLGAQLRLDKGQTARVLESLEKLGLIQRTADPEDGRRRILQITEAGADLVRRVREAERRAADALAEPLSEPEREVLGRLIECVVVHRRAQPGCESGANQTR